VIQSAAMPAFRNLVPDSALNQEMIQLLRTSGGRAPADEVAGAVLQLPGIDLPSAVLLLSELVREDWRLTLDAESGELLLDCEDHDLRPLDQTDYVVFDVETTGPKLPPGRVMELGACRVQGGQIVSEFQTLLNPRAPIPPFVSRLTGITESMVRSAPTFEEVADEWLLFAGDAVLVAHDAPFDVRSVNHEVSLVHPGRRMANTYLCTVTLARRLYPELGFYRLHALAEHFGVPLPNHHRAASDALATAGVFLRLLEDLRQHGVTNVGSARRFNAKTPRRPKRKGVAQSASSADF
jgi:DNA polymerase III epsilon subunit family exonuclease